MIFVTVGTHEQQFNRLIKEIDNLKRDHKLNHEIFMQIGFSDYEPTHCEFKKLLSHSEMDFYMQNSEVVITHGGPATFMSVISNGKTPIVVPRQSRYGEHINNHQFEFAKKVLEKGYQFDLIDDISCLLETIQKNGNSEIEFNSNNLLFCQNLEAEINDIFK